MVVTYHSSNMFAPVVGTSMLSLFENNQMIDEIQVYIIENKICNENKERLRDIARAYGRQLVFIPMPDISEKFQLGLITVKERWIPDSYCRLFLPELLPNNVEKVLYLDSDTLVVDSLQELWELDMQDCFAAAAKDCLGEPYFELLHLEDRQQNDLCCF